MPSRHRSRQRAFQILFGIEFGGQSPEQAVAAYFDTLYSEEHERRPAPDPFMEQLVRGAAARAAEIDQRIAAHSEHWRLERMPAVDRNILRLAIYELLEGASPAAVVIDEALELARRFSGEESVPFINGLLDAVRRELPGQAEIRP